MEAHRLDAHVGAAGDEVLKGVLHLGAVTGGEGGGERYLPGRGVSTGATTRDARGRANAHDSCCVRIGKD